MPHNPLARLLVRWLLCLPPALVVWWILAPPLVALLRLPVTAILSLVPGPQFTVDETMQGDWQVNAKILTETPLGAIPSVTQFEIPAAELRRFTVGLPLAWSLLLAASPNIRRAGRPVLIASGVVMVAALAAMVLYADWKAPADPESSALRRYLTDLAGYLSIHILPFAAPLAAVLALSADLRRLFTSPAK